MQSSVVSIIRLYKKGSNYFHGFQHTHTQTHTHTERQRQKEREGERQTGRQREREREREREGGEGWRPITIFPLTLFKKEKD